jgi:capsular polysaccharide biosynthesis protein
LYYSRLKKDRGESVTMGAGLGPGVSSAEASEGGHTLYLGDLLRVFRKRLLLILVVVVVLAGATMGISLLQTPMYESSIKILIGQEQGSQGSINLGSDVQGLQQLTQTMAEAVDSRPVADEVIRQLGLQTTSEDFLQKNMSVKQIKNTQLIQVSYRDPSPERATQVANTIGDVFSKQVTETSTSANAVTATVWEHAQVPDKPITPNPLRDGVIALVLGLILGTGLAFLLEYLDDSWESPEEAELISGSPNLGLIPNFDVLAAKEEGQ